MKAQMVKNALIVPVGSKGGFVRQAAPAEGGREALLRGGDRVLPDVPARPARPHRQHRRRARSSPPEGSCATTRTTPISLSPPTRAPRRFSDIANGVVRRLRLLARRRVRLGRLAAATTTRRWGSPPAVLGSRSSATSASSAPTSRRPTSRSWGSATCRATCSATGCCFRATSSCSRRSTTCTCSSIPIPDPEASFEERTAAVRAAALGVERLRRRADLRGRRRLSALGQVDADLPPGAVRRSESRPTSWRPAS